MNYAFFLALLSPLFWAATNLIDKYIISRKVTNEITYLPVFGLANFIFGVVLALVLDWSVIHPSMLFFPAIAGIAYAVGTVFYLRLLKREDVTHVIGLVYLYPVLVAVLSFIFIGEQLSWFGYLGMALVLMGIFLLYTRMKKINLQTSIWFIVAVIFSSALQEFMIKLGTTTISPWHGLAISEVVLGCCLSLFLFSKNIQKNSIQEFKNLPYAFLSVVFVFGGIGTLYFALTSLPVTVVSSVAAIQPVAVLMFERALATKLRIPVKDRMLLPKLGAIILIVGGVMLLYIS